MVYLSIYVRNFLFFSLEKREVSIVNKKTLDRLSMPLFIYLLLIANESRLVMKEKDFGIGQIWTLSRALSFLNLEPQANTETV